MVGEIALQRLCTALGGMVLICSCIQVVSPEAAGAQDPGLLVARGVLHSYQGGLSANATGTVKLSVDGEPLEIYWQRPYRTIDFDRRQCNELGAIWEVAYHEEEVDPDVSLHYALDWARCLLDIDADVHLSNYVVVSYLQHIRSGEYTEALEFLAPKFAASISREQLRHQYDHKSTPAYSPLGPNITSTEIVEVRADSVRIRAYMFWFVSCTGPTCCAKYTVEKLENKWRIVAIEEMISCPVAD